MNIEKFFEVFTGGNSNVATWTPKAIKEFAEDYHKQQLRIGGVVSSFTDKEKTAFLIGYQKGIKAKGVDVLNKDK